MLGFNLSQDHNLIKPTHNFYKPTEEEMNILKINECSNSYDETSDYSDSNNNSDYLLPMEMCSDINIPIHDPKTSYIEQANQQKEVLLRNISNLKDMAYENSILDDLLKSIDINLSGFLPKNKENFKGTFTKPKVKFRRKYDEIERTHFCPSETCKKHYNSRGALRVHIKRYHKTEAKSLLTCAAMTVPLRNGVNVNKVLKGKIPIHYQKKEKNADAWSCLQSQMDITVSTIDN